MADNFVDTATRMNASCKELHNIKHWHNSCYTAGYVVESYQKIFISAGLIPTGLSASRYSHDIQRLRNELAAQVLVSSTAGANRAYLIDIEVECPNIFQEWEPIKRYIESTNCWVEAKSVEFIIEQQKCFDMIQKMIVDSKI